MTNPHRPIKPRDEDREQLQADLTRLVGAGRLQFREFDELTEIVWSTQDRADLDRIRARYLTPPGGMPPGTPPQGPPAPQHHQPGYPPVPTPMAQPGANSLVPSGHSAQPVSSTLGSITRSGEWTVPAHSSFKLTGATLSLDLRQAHATSPVVTFEINATMGTIEIVVPPGVHVENRLRESWSSSDIQVTAPAPGAPRVVLIGTVRASEVSVKTKSAGGGRSLWGRIFG